MMNELALFAGAGGGILGGHLLGWSTVCAVECDAYAAQVLAQRQNDGILEPFPIWSDVRTFDGTLWRGIVDVVSGGFPCQDISAAGKCAGIEGERSGLWGEMARIISEVMPRFVFIENSSELISRGLDRVLKDLAEMGFNAKWGCIPAAGFGAPHFRNRAWIIAYANSSAGQELHQRSKQSEQQASHRHDFDGLGLSKHRARSAKTEFHRMDDALANRMDRLKAIGNGQVPRVAAAAFAMMAGQP